MNPRDITRGLHVPDEGKAPRPSEEVPDTEETRARLASILAPVELALDLMREFPDLDTEARLALHSVEGHLRRRLGWPMKGRGDW